MSPVDEKIEIDFVRLSRRQWAIGIAATITASVATLGLIPFAAMMKFAFVKTTLQVIWFFLLFSGTLFGWIWQASTRKKAAVLDAKGIRCWTSFGYIQLNWNDITAVEAFRPSAVSKFYAITLRWNKPISATRYRTKIVLSPGMMSFDTVSVMTFIRNKRPDLVDQIPLPR